MLRRALCTSHVAAVAAATNSASTLCSGTGGSSSTVARPSAFGEWNSAATANNGAAASICFQQQDAFPKSNTANVSSSSSSTRLIHDATECIVCSRMQRQCGIPLGTTASVAGTAASFASIIAAGTTRRHFSTSSKALSGKTKTKNAAARNSLLQAPTVINTLNIGDVSLPILQGNHPERVASGLPATATAFFNPNRPETLRYIRWLAQKDLLRQDVCIVGDPGPTKRWLAMLFAQFAGKEVQLLCLSRDTTEADIKQRKEIRDGTLYYMNQAAVTAALEGQLLIIDGLERAERNVLPVINNLLENREMHLDNGMMLIAHQRYDQLCLEHGVTDLSDWGLLRVSENFRVIGLTVPVPKFSGNPLDPPLRSRFQCLFLDQNGSGAGSTAASQSASMSPTATGSAPTYLTYDVIPKAIRGTQPVETMLKFRTVQNTVDNAGSDRDRLRSFPSVTDFDICMWSRQHEVFPNENLGEILNRVYPIELFLRSGPKAELSARRANIKHLLKRYALSSEDVVTRVTNVTAAVTSTAAAPTALLRFTDGVERAVPCGTLPLLKDPKSHHPLFSSGSNNTSSDVGIDGDDHSSFFTDAHRRVLNGLLQSHTCSRHVALVGSAGCGKTNLIREFAALLGYETETQHLFRDMSTRDLLQRRATDPITGSTTWELSPLMIAVKEGRLAVLDGIDQLSPGALAVLQELLLDGNITLFDGTVFKNEKAFEELKRDVLKLSSDAEMNARGIFKVHPSFRLIATSRYPVSDAGAKKVWLTSDLVPLLDWHVLPDLDVEAVFSLLGNVTKRFAAAYGGGAAAGTAAESANLRASDVTSDELMARQSSKQYQSVLASLVEFQHHLAEMSRTESKIPTLTLRQLRHIAKHVLVFPDDLFGILESSLLLPLTSQLIANQVKNAMAKFGISDGSVDESIGRDGRRKTNSSSSSSAAYSSSLSVTSRKAGNPFEVIAEPMASASSTSSSEQQKKTVCKSFGHEVMHVTRQYSSKEKAIVPHVPSFHANRLQLTLQAWIAKNLASGNNILLVGNQGVGKNKIVDQLLMEVGLPRHYLQLHRDTTVSSLTINPTVVEGKVMWEDSPLVKAVQQGHVLVVDEIDKAPVEVVHILKGLIEDREMRLGDGRKVSGWHHATADGKPDPNIIPIHPDFRVIVLANPPGFPFHGNDFYRECGDLFSCFVVQNPDPSSQQELLQKIAPQIPAILITKLIMVFTELGALFAAGTIQYPFSLRELIAVVKHLQAFPRDGLYQALNNVFSFDLLNENTMNHVRRLLHQYISPITQAQLKVGMGENLVAKETLLGKLLNMATFTVQPAAMAPSTLLTGPTAADAAPKNFAIVKAADAAAKLTYGNVVVGTASASANDPATPFTERISTMDFSHLLKKGEVVIGTRQIGASVSATGGGRTIVLTNKNRVLVLPTPTAANAGGAIAGVSGITLGGSAAAEDEDAAASANAFGNVAIIKLPADVSTASSIILGDSIPLAESVLSVATNNAVSAADQTNIVHLVSASADDSELQLTTVAVPMPSATPTAAGPTVVTTSFKNVTAACTRLAAEGLVAVASSSSSSAAAPTITMLYYGRIAEISLAADVFGGATKITRIDALSSQVMFIVGDNGACGFLKLSVFRDRCEAYFHKAAITDVPPPAGKKPGDVDARLRLSAASIQNLLVNEGSFAGIATGEGYVPTPGPLSAENIQNALFVMNTNNGRIAPKDVIYAKASAEAISEEGMLMVTFEGAVNRSDKTVQLVPASGASTSGGASIPAGNGGAGAGAGGVSKMLGGSAWTKVAEYGSASSGAGSISSAAADAAVAAGSNSHSHSAAFGHHQLVAKDANSAAVSVVSTQKGTIREFSTTAAPAASAGIMGKARSFFGGGNSASSAASGAEAALNSADPSSLITSVGSDGIGSTVTPSGAMSSFDTNAERLNEGYSRWNSVLKGGVQDLGQPPTPEEMEMWYSKPKKQSNKDNLKHGEEDPDNTPHSGGNNWAGGTGGTDTAGLGGMAGPYRLDKGHPVTQVDPAEKKKVPQHILDEARRMGKEALEKRLKEINMSVNEDERYRDAYERVQGPVQQLQSMLEGMKSKEKERAWMRHQTDGVWDDAKLVEGVTGEKTVYKRRIESEDNQPFGKPEAKKRLLFVMDVSASMYRFNGMDQRLSKSVECAIMIMESFKGHEDKIDYSIIGHNGDSGNLPLVPFGQPPTNKKQRMDVCMKMIAYSQFCWSGDNTVTAMEKSVDIVTAEPADGYFVFVISDANFQQYGISPKHLARIIKSNDAVHMFCIFIASIGQQAKAIQMQLPAGHGFECYDTTRMPLVLQQIFQATDVLN